MFPLDIIRLIIYNSDIKTVGRILSVYREIDLDWDIYFKKYCDKRIYHMVTDSINLKFMKSKGIYLLNIMKEFSLIQWTKYIHDLIWVERYIIKCFEIGETPTVCINIHPNSPYCQYLIRKHKFKLRKNPYFQIFGNMDLFTGNNCWNWEYNGLLYENIKLTTPFIQYIYKIISKEYVHSIKFVDLNSHKGICIENIRKKYFFKDGTLITY